MKTNLESAIIRTHKRKAGDVLPKYFQFELSCVSVLKWTHFEGL
jgi:hypothetical protein